MGSKLTHDCKLILESYLHWITDNLLPILQWYRKGANPDDIPSLKISASDCPLCKQYLKIYTGEDVHFCTGCPISEITGNNYCNQTPYEKVSIMDEEPFQYQDYGLKLIKAIWEECMFLKTLYRNVQEKVHKCSH